MTEPVTKEYVVKVLGQGIKQVVQELQQMNSVINSTTTSSDKLTREQVRQEKVNKGVAGATNNSTKAFSKMKDGIGGLVPIYASIAANVFALSAAFGALARAADFEVLTRASQEFGIRTGVSLTSIASSMTKLTHGAISLETALQSASIASAAGFDSKTIEDLTKAARNASQALGRDLTDSMNRVFRGAIKAEPELLDELGIILRLQTATKNYANELGKSVRDLTTFEKQQAVVNEVLKQTNEKFADLSESVPVNPYSRLASSFDLVAKSGLNLFTKVLTPILNFFSENISSLIALLAIFTSSILSKTIPVLEKFGVTIHGAVNNAISDTTKLVAKYNEGLKSMELATAKVKKTAGYQFKLLGLDIKTAIRDIQVARDSLETPVATPKGLLDVLNMKTGSTEGLKKFINSINGLLGNVAKGYKVVGLETEAQIAKLTRLRDESIVALKAQEAAVRGSINVWKAYSATVGLAMSNTVKGLTAIASAAVTGGLSAAAAAYDKGLKGLIENIKNTKNELKKLGIEAGITAISVSVASKIIAGSMALFLEWLPIIGWVIIAFQVLSSILKPVADFLGLTSKSSRELGESTRALGNEIELLDKKIVRYTNVLDGLPDTLENVNKKLQFQINMLSTVGTNLDDLIDRLQAGNFGMLDRALNLVNAGNLAKTRTELTNLANSLKSVNPEGVRSLLESIGELDSIEALLKLALGLQKIRDEYSQTARETLDSNKALEESFNGFDKTITDWANNIPKLNATEKAFSNINTIISLLSNTAKSSNLTQLFAGMTDSAANLLGIEIEQLQRMKLVIEQKLTAQKKLDQLNKRDLYLRLKQEETRDDNSYYPKYLARERNKIAADIDALRLELTVLNMESKGDSDYILRKLKVKSKQLQILINSEKEYVKTQAALNNELQTGAKYEVDKARIIEKQANNLTKLVNIQRDELRDRENAKRKTVADAGDDADKRLVAEEELLAVMQERAALESKYQVETQGQLGDTLKLYANLYDRYNDGEMLVSEFTEKENELVETFLRVGRQANISDTVLANLLANTIGLNLETRNLTQAERERAYQQDLAIRANATAARVIDELKTETEKYTDELTLLSIAFAKEALTEEEFKEKINRMHWMTDEFVSSAETIEDAFKDSFVNMFDEGFKSFRSFTKSILNEFKRLLAEMVAKAIARPIIVPIIQGMGNILGAGDLAGTAMTKFMGSTAGQTANSGFFSSGAGAAIAGGFTAFSGGLSAGLSGGFSAAGTIISGYAGMGSSAGLGGLAASMGAAVGAAIPYVAAAYAVDKITGGALFGTKWKKVNSQIKLAIDEFEITGKQIDKYTKKKSLFRGNKRKTKISDIPDELEDYLDGIGLSLKFALKDFGTKLNEEVATSFNNFDYTYTTTRKVVKFIGGSLKVIEEEVKKSLLEFSSDPEKFKEQFGNAMKKALTASFSDSEIKTAISNIDFTDFASGLEDLAWAVNFVTGELFGLKEVSDAALAIRAVNDEFDALALKAEQLGMSTDNLESARAQRLVKLTSTFNEDIAAAILAIQDPLQAELAAQEKIGETRLKNARDLGADLLAVEQLNALERQQILTRFAEEQTATLQRILDFNADISKQIEQIVRTRGLTGLDLELENLAIEFEDLREQAVALGASTDLVNELFSEKQIDIIAEYAKQEAERQQDILDYNNNLADQITQLQSLRGLDGLDLDLAQLNFEFEELRKRTIEAGGSLVLVEELFGERRIDIIEKYNKEASEALEELGKELFAFNRELTSDIASYILDPFNKAMLDLQNSQEDRLAEATRVGADIVRVEYLSLLERQKLVQDFAKEFVDSFKGIDDFMTNVSFSSVSPLKTGDQLALAQSMFDSQLALAQEGNLESIEALPELAERLLELSQSFFGGTAEYKTTFANVTSQLSELLVTQRDPVVEEINKAAAQSVQNTTQIVNSLGTIRQELEAIKAQNQSLTDYITLLQSGAPA